MKDLYKAAKQLVWVTQLGFSVVMPPVLCLLGGMWLRSHLECGGWILWVAGVIGLLGAVGGFRSSLQALDRESRAEGQTQKTPPISFNQH